MAKFIESYTYEGLEGKSWASVKARVLEFRAALSDSGASEIVLLEGGLGEDNGTITMQMHFASAEAWGKFVDGMTNNAAWEAKMEAWQKDPRVNYKRAASYTVIA